MPMSSKCCWCQLDTNRIPNLRYGEGGVFIQCKQLNRDTAGLWKNMSLRLPLPLRCAEIGPLSFQLGKPRLQWKGKVCSQGRGNLTYIVGISTTGPSLGGPHANEDTKSSQFDWSKKHCLIGQNGATLIGR